MSDHTRVRAVARGRHQVFRGDQLMVALPHVDIVVRQLEAWAAGPRLIDTDGRLGLALVRLDAASALVRLRRQLITWVNEAVSVAEDGGVTADDLDVVVWCLRHRLRQRYAGWSPRIGKNRILERPIGACVDRGGVAQGATRCGPDGAAIGGPRGGLPGPIRPRGLRPGGGARVGLVDARLAPHPWLEGGYIASARDLAVVGEAHRGDLTDHATVAAGLVLRQAPGAVVEVRAALDASGSTDTWSLATTLVDVAERGADVILVAVGCVTDDGRAPLSLEAALAAIRPGTLVVAAAGTHVSLSGDDTGSGPSWPAAMDQVIAVGALDGTSRADFSPDEPWVDVLAPGVDVVSTCDQEPGGFGRRSGTCVAAAAVAGAIAGHLTAGLDAGQAWDELLLMSKRTDSGQPVITLRRPSTWPSDDRLPTLSPV